MDVRLKRAKELAGYAVRLTKDEGLPTMVKRGAGFVRRRFFGKRARYLPGRKVLEAQRAEMAGKTAEDCGLPTISILTPLYNTPENYLREFLDSFVGQTAPNGQLCLADASDDAHPEVERIVREYQQKNQRIGYKKVENKGIAANTNAAEALADGEYLALADHDDVLAPHAMYAMGKAILQLRQRGEPDGFVYSDEALFSKSIKKPMVGHFKPDYAPDYLLCCNYICHLAVFRRALYEQLGGERPACDGSQDHDLFLRLIEQTGGAAICGAMLYYPDETLQHAGVVTGLGGYAGHSHKYKKAGGSGYMFRTATVQDFSAVTGACLLVKASVWDEVDGLDEKFAVAFNDVDFCLRVRDRGYRIAWTPYAQLTHYESKSRGGDEKDPAKAARFAAEQQRLYDVHGKADILDDPYYNPSLTRDREDFSESGDLRNLKEGKVTVRWRNA